MTQTKKLKVPKSTLAMNFANSKGSSRTYKVDAKTTTACTVAVKVNGAIKANINFAIRNGEFVQLPCATATPVDIAEATVIAKKVLKIK